MIEFAQQHSGVILTLLGSSWTVLGVVIVRKVNSICGSITAVVKHCNKIDDRLIILETEHKLIHCKNKKPLPANIQAES